VIRERFLASEQESKTEKEEVRGRRRKSGRMRVRESGREE
jgi:hypothetical protein